MSIKNDIEYEKQFDTNHDGIVTDKEIMKAEKMIDLENQDKKEDAQRNMSWFALFGMLLYPFAVIVANVIGLDQAPQILGDMAPTYFVSVAAIVGAFYAKEGYVAKKTEQNKYTSEN